MLYLNCIKGYRCHKIDCDSCEKLGINYGKELYFFECNNCLAKFIVMENGNVSCEQWSETNTLKLENKFIEARHCNECNEKIKRYFINIYSITDRYFSFNILNIIFSYSNRELDFIEKTYTCKKIYFNSCKLELR
jgi:hypothetical protein